MPLSAKFKIIPGWFGRTFATTRHFVWFKPKAFLAAAEEEVKKRRRWWVRPMQVLVICLVAFAEWLGAKLSQPDTLVAHALPLALVIGVFCGLVFAYGLPWLIARCPSRIVVYDRLLHRSQGNWCPQFWFKDLSAFEYCSGPEFATLVLTRRDGRKVFVGVPLDFPGGDLTAFLMERIPAN